MDTQLTRSRSKTSLSRSTSAASQLAKQLSLTKKGSVTSNSSDKTSTLSRTSSSRSSTETHQRLARQRTLDIDEVTAAKGLTADGKPRYDLPQRSSSRGSVKSQRSASKKQTSNSSMSSMRAQTSGSRKQLSASSRSSSGSMQQGPVTNGSVRSQRSSSRRQASLSASDSDQDIFSKRVSVRSQSSTAKKQSSNANDSSLTMSQLCAAPSVNIVEGDNDSGSDVDRLDDHVDMPSSPVSSVQARADRVGITDIEDDEDDDKSEKSNPNDNVLAGDDEDMDVQEDKEDDSNDKLVEMVDDFELNDDVAATSSDNAGPSTSAPLMLLDGPAPIEIMISFDTTGSMSSYLDEVKAQVQDIIQRLFMDIPNLRIGVLVHGDYCDEKAFYLMKKVDFTNDLNALCQFVNEVDGTGGGDYPECYEWVLRQVRLLPWTPGTQRSLVMIGDAIPHEPDYHLNTEHLDWRDEADALFKDQGVRIYAIQCQNEDGAEAFWQDLAVRTRGQHLRLDKISTIVDILMAICYREHGADHFEAWVNEVQTRAGPAHGLDTAFDALRSTPFVPKPKKTVNFDFSRGAAKHPKPKPVKVPTAHVPKPGPSGKPKAATPKKAGAIAKAAKRSPKALAPKQRKEAKAAAKATRGSTGKAQSKKIVKLKRELVPQTKFLYNKLKWSKWELAMRPDNPGDKKWKPNRRGRPGFRNTELFKKDFTATAIYEFAVQKGARTKKYITYSCVRKSFTRKLWDTYLFGDDKRDHIATIQSSVLRQGCSIYARRAILPKSHTVKTPHGKVPLRCVRNYHVVLSRYYDYAWKRNVRGGKYPDYREIKRKGVYFSHSKNPPAHL